MTASICVVVPYPRPRPNLSTSNCQYESTNPVSKVHADQKTTLIPNRIYESIFLLIYFVRRVVARYGIITNKLNNYANYQQCPTLLHCTTQFPKINGTLAYLGVKS